MSTFGTQYYRWTRINGHDLLFLWNSNGAQRSRGQDHPYLCHPLAASLSFSLPSQSHESTCPHRPTPCHYSRCTSLEQGAPVDHQRVCPCEPVACMVSGCTTAVPRGGIYPHVGRDRYTLVQACNAHARHGARAFTPFLCPPLVPERDGTPLFGPHVRRSG